MSSSASRRSFLTGAAATGVVVAGGAGFGLGHAAASPAKQTDSSAGTLSLYGEHQPGIDTVAQDRLAFAAFDVITTDRLALEEMLGSWAAAAERMMAGLPIGATETLPDNPPVDTGEAMGLDPSKLTVTVGFGASLFDRRFGLADKRPAALIDIPSFSKDALDPASSGGDLCVQACSDDPQVAFHVIRNFARIGRGVATLRWSQLGFGRTSTTSRSQSTPRNLMGFKDGTNNIKAEDAKEMGDFVWVGSDNDQPWMAGGTYLVTRRIRMLIEAWDGDYIADQQKVFGRVKDSGAPLSGTKEFDAPALGARNAAGRVIDANAHIRWASPASHGGTRILRRGYSYTDGLDAQTGLLDAGLFFICFNRDPRTQFVPIQRQLDANDLLNEYISHTSSGLFAVPGGVGAVGDWFGKKLFS